MNKIPSNTWPAYDNDDGGGGGGDSDSDDNNGRPYV